jgi:hypothetical protein
MIFRILAIACLFTAMACSKPDAPKAQGKKEVATARPVTVDADGVPAAIPAPDDITRFITRREECDHFRGEEAYDEERGRFLRDNLERTCTGTDAELAELKRKYANRDDVTKRLSEFESTIE